MTIGTTTDYIISHPFFKQAIERYNSGDSKDIIFLLKEVQIHCWLTVSQDCAFSFRQNKRLNDPQIVLAIKDTPPPEKLNIRLPIPLKTKVCKVVPLPIKPKQVKKFKIPNQLELELTDTNKKATPVKRMALVG